ncbi:hypothetical protein OH76DRAFT_1324111, partial [Lentinus brumalis]
DPHQDTALGRLHLVLLGFTKYLWAASLPPSGCQLTIGEKAARDDAEAWLHSLSQAGLGDRSVRVDYVMRYCSSLVGRHLHSIAQLGIFIFGHHTDKTLLDAWIALSRLSAALITEMIKVIKAFIVSVWFLAQVCSLTVVILKRLHVLIDDFFDVVVTFNPTWAMYKSKFHHLTHTPQFIKRFGPIGLY